jgi:hypothetical protein
MDKPSMQRLPYADASRTLVISLVVILHIAVYIFLDVLVAL